MSKNINGGVKVCRLHPFCRWQGGQGDLYCGPLFEGTAGVL